MHISRSKLNPKVFGQVVVRKLVLLHEVTSFISTEAKYLKSWGPLAVIPSHYLQGSGINRGAPKLIQTSGYKKEEEEVGLNFKPI